MAQQSVDTPHPERQRLKMSYDEFLEWSGEDTHAEWVNGEVIVFMPPKTAHQRISLLLATLLSLYTRFFNLGDVLTAPFEMRLWIGRSSREPDILFVAREHQDRLTADRLEGPADLVVELVSNDSVARDREDKFREYEEAGVQEYWIVDPRPGKRRIDVYRLTPEGSYQEILPDADGHYHAAVLPGFWFDPAWLWQDPLPDPTMLLLTRIAPEMLCSALHAAGGAPGSATIDS
jgi:Uma2 family endonuclease